MMWHIELVASSIVLAVKTDQDMSVSGVIFCLTFSFLQEHQVGAARLLLQETIGE